MKSYRHYMHGENNANGAAAACAWCGVIVPEEDALRSGERNYCCAECRSAAEKKGGD